MCAQVSPSSKCRPSHLLLILNQAIVKGASGVSTDNPSIIANNTQGIVFLGTPFHGSPSAKYMEILRRVIQVFHSTNAKKIHDLKEKSEKLEILVEAFASRLRQRLSDGKELGVYFFCETLTTHGILVFLARPFIKMLC